MKMLAVILMIISINLANAQTSQPIAKKSISADDIKQHTTILASDDMQGRSTGSQGAEKAAEYISNKFKEYGLVDISPNGNFYQFIPMHGSKTTSKSELKIFSDGFSATLHYCEDYVLYKTGEQTFLPRPINTVFAGFGIDADEYNYNDYDNIDVKGKVVVVMSGEPISNDNAYFNGAIPTIYSYPESKQRIAMAHGAAGIIIIPNPYDYVNMDWQTDINDYLFEHVSLAYTPSSIFSALINPKKAHILFNDSRFSLKDLYEMYFEDNLKSFPLNSRVSFKGDFIQREFLGRNVIAMIEGSDESLKDEYLVVSAHYDHLGIGAKIDGDSIYNGLNDNAVGVAAVLEIAESISKMNQKPKRSIIFLLTDGEEKGLLGSNYFLEHSPVYLNNIIANINIDGLAFIDEFNSVIPVGSQYSSLFQAISNIAIESGLQLEEYPDEFIEIESFNRSDQIAFAKAGIPSVIIMEGTKYNNIKESDGKSILVNYFENHYHKPSDDSNQYLNYLAMQQHTSFIFDVLVEVANDDTSPKWDNNSPYSRK